MKNKKPLAKSIYSKLPKSAKDAIKKAMKSTKKYSNKK